MVKKQPDGLNFFSALRKGFAFLAEGMTRITLFPSSVSYSIEEMQEKLSRESGIDFFDDKASQASDWQRVGNDMKNVLNGFK